MPICHVCKRFLTVFFIFIFQGVVLQPREAGGLTIGSIWLQGSGGGCGGSDLEEEEESGILRWNDVLWSG